MKDPASSASNYVDKSQGLREASSRRKAETLDRIEAGKAEALRLLKENEGIYPYNSGRLSRAEICRLAKIKPSLLMQPAHHGTTKIDLDKWLSDILGQAAKGKYRTRKIVTDSISKWKCLYEEIQTNFHIVELELEEKTSRIKSLEAEIADLRTILDRYSTSRHVERP